MLEISYDRQYVSINIEMDYDYVSYGDSESEYDSDPYEHDDMESYDSDSEQSSLEYSVNEKEYMITYKNDVLYTLTKDEQDLLIGKIELYLRTNSINYNEITSDECYNSEIVIYGNNPGKYPKVIDIHYKSKSYEFRKISSVELYY